MPKASVYSLNMLIYLGILVRSIVNPEYPFNDLNLISSRVNLEKPLILKAHVQANKEIAKLKMANGLSLMDGSKGRFKNPFISKKAIISLPITIDLFLKR